MQHATGRTIVIEPFVEDPNYRASQGRSEKHWINEGISRLNQNEMFFVDAAVKTEHKLRMQVSQWGKVYGFKMSVRVCKRDGVDGYRIIRLE